MIPTGFIPDCGGVEFIHFKAWWHRTDLEAILILVGFWRPPRDEEHHGTTRRKQDHKDYQEGKHGHQGLAY